uniref:Uncharacterized protein n=1 Tax=Triticum urartu TaxID=4572 RepID=A0A8R7TG27_TRIUA
MSSIVQPCWLMVDVVVILLLGGRGCELSCCLVEKESHCLYWRNKLLRQPCL